MRFEQIEYGAKFFDPYSGEFFVKVCGNAAECITGGDAFTGSLITFDPDEIVEAQP